MDIVLKLFADKSLEIDHDAVLQADVLDGAHVPQILFIIAVAHSISQPLDTLLAVAAMHHKHLIAYMYLHYANSETIYQEKQLTLIFILDADNNDTKETKDELLIWNFKL